MNTNFSDREKLTDALMSQRFITGNYNSFANECAHPEVKQLAMDILSEEHCIQHDVFVEMQNRGWYEVTAAQPQMVQQTKSKLENSNG